MKTIVIFFLLLITRAHACPNLEGGYKCRTGSNDRETFSVEQKTEGNLVIYFIDREKIMTDDYWRTKKSDNSNFVRRLKARCDLESQSLVIETHSEQYLEDEDETAFMDLTRTIHLNKFGHWVDVVIGVARLGKTVVPIENRIVCRRVR